MILELLQAQGCVGCENALKASEICRILGIDRDTLRRCLEYERSSGIVIASGAHGYYSPQNSADYEKFIKTVEKRAKSSLKMLKSAKKELRRVKQEEQGQGGIF